MIRVVRWRAIDAGTIRHRDVCVTFEYRIGSPGVEVWFDGSFIMDRFRVPLNEDNLPKLLDRAALEELAAEYGALMQDSEVRAVLSAMSIPRRR